MSNNRSNNNSSGFVGGLLVGTAIGVVVGLLTAPRTGRETRQLLKKSAEALPELAEDLSTSVQLQAERLSETAIQQWQATLLRLQTAVAAGIEASQEVQRMTTVSQRPVEPLPDQSPYLHPIPTRSFDLGSTVNSIADEAQSPRTLT